MVDQVGVVLAVEVAEFVIGIPLVVEDAEKSLQARIVELDADAPAEAALFAGARKAEKVVEMNRFLALGGELAGPYDFDDRVESVDKEGQRHDTCGGSGVFRVVRWRYFRLGQPVFNDLVAVVLEVTDQVSMHGLIIPQGPLGCLRILGIFLRIFSQNKKKDPFYMAAELCQSSSSTKRADRCKSRRVVQQLSDSRLYKDYQDAFRRATGLSLALRPLKAYENALAASEQANPFCSQLAQTDKGCANCLRVQEQLEREAGSEPRSLHCFAGLCDSVVPIRVGDELVALLQTGQVLLHQPHREEFTRTTRQLLAWGAAVDLEALEEAYFQTKVFDREQYDAMLRLLATFAEHLATISNSIGMQEGGSEPKLVSKVKKYIQGRYFESISLDDAAQAVNASTRHFCKVFKSSTGITFTDYLARVRVEKAKNLLQNPHLRVSEIAFETGFESISQFNRSFKRITGLSPTQFREEA